MNEPISVVITCYNLERYIGAAIRSVQTQDYDGEVEIVVVDDGSADGSADVIRGFPGIRYVRMRSNGGVLLAAMSGIRQSSHDIVAFLDGDDVWHPAKLRRVQEAFRKDSRIGFVTHDLSYVDALGKNIDRVTRPAHVFKDDAGSAARDRLLRDGLLGQADYVWLGSAMTIRRSAVRLDEFLRFAESLADPGNTYQDWPLAVWCAANSEVRLEYVPKKLFDYRLHGLNHSGDASSTEKALRNIERTINTLVACESIISRFGAANDCLIKTRRKRNYFEGLLYLYRGRRLQAWRRLFASAGYLLGGDADPLKEVARLLGVSALGYSRFYRAARWVSRERRLDIQRS